MHGSISPLTKISKSESPYIHVVPIKLTLIPSEAPAHRTMFSQCDGIPPSLFCI